MTKKKRKPRRKFVYVTVDVNSDVMRGLRFVAKSTGVPTSLVASVIVALELYKLGAGAKDEQ